MTSQCPRSGSLDHVERIYREHPEVEHIAVFDDRLGQRVALVVTERPERELRRVLDDIADRSSDCACITDYVALAPDDPLVPAMFTASGDQRRDLIWQLLVGCIDTLTRSADRLASTGERPAAAPRCIQARRGREPRRGGG